MATSRASKPSPFFTFRVDKPSVAPPQHNLLVEHQNDPAHALRKAPWNQLQHSTVQRFGAAYKHG